MADEQAVKTNKYGINWPKTFINNQIDILQKRIKADDDEYNNYYNRVYVEKFWKDYVPKEIERRKKLYKELQDQPKIEKLENKEETKEITGTGKVQKSNFDIKAVNVLMTLPTFQPSETLELLYKQYQEIVQQMREEKHKLEPDISKITALTNSLVSREEKLLNVAYSEYENWFVSPERNKAITNSKMKTDLEFYPKEQQEKDFANRNYPTREQDEEDLQYLLELKEVIDKLL